MYYQKSESNSNSEEEYNEEEYQLNFETIRNPVNKKEKKTEDFSVDPENEKFQHMNLIVEACDIGYPGNLYLGDFMSATDIKQLKKKNIKSVITCAIDLDIKLTQNFEHIVFEIEDSNHQEIYSIFEKFNQTLHENLLRGSVLVHCAAGISRSAALCLAFIMKKKNWDFRTSLGYLKSKRFVVNPNMGFIKQLKKYEKILGRKIEDDALLDKIQKQNEQNLYSLQDEIIFKERLNQKNSVIQNDDKNYEKQKNQLPPKFQPRKIASAQQGFRLADLVSLQKPDETVQTQKNNTVIMENQIKFQKQLQQKEHSQKYYGLNTFYKKNNKVDVNQLNKNKLINTDISPISSINKKTQNNQNSNQIKTLNRNMSSKNMKNSYQKLQQITGKLIKEEQELAYNKFEYKPRFKRLGSAATKENIYISSQNQKKNKHQSIEQERLQQNNNNNINNKYGLNCQKKEKNDYNDNLNSYKQIQKESKQNGNTVGFQSITNNNNNQHHLNFNNLNNKATLARHQKAYSSNINSQRGLKNLQYQNQRNNGKQVNFEQDLISDSLIDDFQNIEQQILGSQIDYDFNDIKNNKLKPNKSKNYQSSRNF